MTQRLIKAVATRCVAICALLCYANASHAQSDSAKWYDRISVNGLVSGSYTYNFNRPDNRMNTLRVFDVDHNSIEFDLAELVVQHDPALGEAGFRLDMDVGPHIPAITHSFGLDIKDFDFHQVYLSYLAPVGSGLKIDLGKFVTLPGYEVIEGYDGYNENASHSFLFGYAIPYAHTGLRASYTFGEALSATAMIVNGWDNVVDNNSDKTLGLLLKLTPIKEVSISLTGITGTEQPQNNHDRRSLIDLSSTIAFSDMLSLGISADYGNEDPLPAVWEGVAGYLRVKPSSTFAMTLRAEAFNDRDGVRTGIPQTLREFTLTPELHITPHLILRSDIRLDQSTEAVFLKRAFTDSLAFNDDSRSTSQATVSLNAIVVF